MPKKKSDKKSEQGEEAHSSVRRNVLIGSGALIAGAVAGRASAPQAKPAKDAPPPAPELPWEWAKIDPMEAGSRTYKAYLEQGG